MVCKFCRTANNLRNTKPKNKYRQLKPVHVCSLNGEERALHLVVNTLSVSVSRFLSRYSLYVHSALCIYEQHVRATATIFLNLTSSHGKRNIGFLLFILVFVFFFWLFSLVFCLFVIVHWTCVSVKPKCLQNSIYEIPLKDHLNSLFFLSCDCLKLKFWVVKNNCKAKTVSNV